MSLAQCKDSNEYTIVEIKDSTCREQILRMGFSEGATLMCITNIQRGPVVVRHMHTDVAIGRGMAERIWVELTTAQQVSSRGEVAHGNLSSGYRFRYGQNHKAKR